jgi:hypothetical protein
MAPYYPVFISRSDGRLETTSLRTKKKEANAPNEALLNVNREVNGNRDYYKAIEVGDAKEVDWRRKLGSMLMKEIGDKEHSGNTNPNKFEYQDTEMASTKIYSGSLARELSALRTCEGDGSRSYWPVKETEDSWNEY